MHREQIHTRLVKWRVLLGDAFSIFFSKCGRDVFSTDLKSPVKLQKRTITALVSDSSSLSSLNAASAFFPLLSMSHPGSSGKLSRGIMRREGRPPVTLVLHGVHPPHSCAGERDEVADTTSHLALTHTVHKMTEIVTGWEAGISVQKYPSLADVLRQMALGKCWEDNSAGVIGYNS